MCASLWPATPSKRQPRTEAWALGLHSSVWPMSLWGSRLQEDGDLGAAETSALMSPPRAAWHLIQRPILSHRNGGAGRMEQQRVGGMGGPGFKSPLHHLQQRDPGEVPGLCFLIRQHRVKLRYELMAYARDAALQPPAYHPPFIFLIEFTMT